MLNVRSLFDYSYYPLDFFGIYFLMQTVSAIKTKNFADPRTRIIHSSVEHQSRDRIEVPSNPVRYLPSWDGDLFSLHQRAASLA